MADGAKLYLLADKDQNDKGHKLTTQAVVLQVDDSFARELPGSYPEERWYAAYTSANHEKRVAKQLEERAVEHFLPLYRSVRRWSDRRVQIDLPLFPGYVFVHLALRDRLRVLQVPGVAKLVGFGGLPAALPDEQVEALRAGLNESRVEPHPYLTVGRRVRVLRGPFQGAEGIWVRRKGIFRVVLSLEAILRSIAVEVDVVDVEPLSSQKQDGDPEARTSVPSQRAG